MAYCTKQDLIDRFGEAELIQLTDRPDPATGATTGAIVDSVLNQAIADADAEINGYLAKYTLPLATVPTVLVRSACDLARYFLMDDAATAQATKRYEAVLKFLREVGKGAISLGVDASGNKPTPNDGAVMESGGRVFGRDDNGFL